MIEKYLKTQKNQNDLFQKRENILKNLFFQYIIMNIRIRKGASYGRI